MKINNLFFKTNPNEKTNLLKGGFVNQVSAGLYDYMPIAIKSLERIKKIIRDELSDLNEVSFSIVSPIELWNESGRNEKMGKEMLRIYDRNKKEYVFSPTNEEAAVNFIKNKVSSYKQLPINIFQINEKFRDEIRPRAGLIRSRQFIMKDGYSFHKDESSLDEEFSSMKNKYINIFKKIGIDFRIVQADSGNIGGNGSLEFHFISENGDDELLICNSCSYGRNIEVSGADICSCGNHLTKAKGIEIAHIFKLGTTYSESMNAFFVDENNKKRNFVMGCYGIGVSRLLSVLVEDKSFFTEIAPFKIGIITVGKDEQILNKAQEIYEFVKSRGISCLFDDRNDSFGKKILDHELMKIPINIIIGNTFLENGKITLIDRIINDKIDTNNIKTLIKVIE